MENMTNVNKKMIFVTLLDMVKNDLSPTQKSNTSGKSNMFWIRQTITTKKI
jgi:hypothetical protein